MAETMLYVNEHLHDQLWDGPERRRSRSAASRPATTSCSTSPTATASSSAATRPSGARSSCSSRALGLEHLADDPRFVDVASRQGATSTSCATLLLDAAARRSPTRRRSRSSSPPTSLAVGRAAQRPRARRHRTGPRRAGRSSRCPTAAAARSASPTRRGTSATPTSASAATPRYRGEDNRAVLAELLGYDDADDRRPRGRRGAVEPGAIIAAGDAVVPRRADEGDARARCRPRTPAGRTRSSGTATARSPSSRTGAVRLQSSNLYDVTAKYPELAALAGGDRRAGGSCSTASSSCSTTRAGPGSS